MLLIGFITDRIEISARVTKNKLEDNRKGSSEDKRPIVDNGNEMIPNDGALSDVTHCRAVSCERVLTRTEFGLG